MSEWVFGCGFFMLLVVGFWGPLFLNELLEGSTAFVFATSRLIFALIIPTLVAAHMILKGLVAPSVREVILGLMLMAIMFFSLVGVLMLANEKLDASAPQEHEVKLLDTYFAPLWYRRGSAGGHHVTFTSWRDRPTEDIVVRYETYRLAEKSRGQTWRLRIREGWLGHRWVESVGPVDGSR